MEQRALARDVTHPDIVTAERALARDVTHPDIVTAERALAREVILALKLLASRLAVAHRVDVADVQLQATGRVPTHRWLRLG